MYYYFLLFFCLINLHAADNYQSRETTRLLPAGMPIEIYNQKSSCLEPRYWIEKICTENKPIDPCSFERCQLRIAATLCCPITLVACYITGCIQGVRESGHAYTTEKKELEKYRYNESNICKKCCAESDYLISPCCVACLHPCLFGCHNSCDCCFISISTVLCDSCNGSTIDVIAYANIE